MDKSVMVRPLRNKVKNVVKSTWPSLNLKGLTKRQKRFCMLFCGDPIMAAKMAGYSDKNTARLKRIAWSLMARKQIRDNCRIIEKNMSGVMIAHSEEILCFFTDSMRDPSLSQSDRHNAAKTLAMYRGLLSERLLIEERSVSHNIQEYIFRGPKSNFLKSREDAAQGVIDVTPSSPMELTDIELI